MQFVKTVIDHIGMLACLAVLLVSQVSHAGKYESDKRINEVAKNFLINSIQIEPGETIEVKVNQSNTPLQVSACLGDITANYPKNANKDLPSTVELSCNNPQPWHIFVPVDVQIFTKVIVAKRTIAPKEVITDEDIDYVAYNKNRLFNGFFTKREDVAGNETSRLVTAGTILTKKNVQLPLLVHRNQMVSLISQSNAVIVTMQGIAKDDGSLNSLIKVYNPSSKRTVEAIVIGPNKAQISV